MQQNLRQKDDKNQRKSFQKNVDASVDVTRTNPCTRYTLQQFIMISTLKINMIPHLFRSAHQKIVEQPSTADYFYASCPSKIHLRHIVKSNGEKKPDTAAIDRNISKKLRRRIWPWRTITYQMHFLRTSWTFRFSWNYRFCRRRSMQFDDCM